MSVITAQILVGNGHPEHGGIINVTHTIFLSENDRPSWILQALEQPERKMIWLPTEEGMLEDAIVMAGIYILKDREIMLMADRYIKSESKNYIQLKKDISPENLHKLYERARQIQTDAKFAVHVYAGSSIQQQLDILKDYDFDLEVCQSVYRKQFSVGTQKREEYGLLDSIMW